MSDKLRIAIAIRRLREEAGYTQEEIASEIGVCQATLSRAERAVTTLSLPVLILFCSFLKTTVEAFAREAGI